MGYFILIFLLNIIFIIEIIASQNVVPLSMIILAGILNLLGLLLSFIGFIGVYRHRDNIFGKVSNLDISSIKEQLTASDPNLVETTTKTILNKVTRAHDYFICILVGFLLEFISVTIMIFGIIYQVK